MEPVSERLFVQHTEDTTLVTFNDEEILEEGDIKAIEKSIMTVVDQGKCQNMLLDFSNVQFMSSAFLGLLIKIHKRICENGGKLQLCKINPQIYKVFEITQLNKIFYIS